MRIGYFMSVAIAAAIAMPVTVFAAGNHAHGNHDSGHMQPALATAKTIQGKGVIKAVKGKTVTLSHEAIPALKWPAMTMDFMLEDPTSAKGLRAGDAVVFELKPMGGSYVISAISAESRR